uniref:CHK domain-containing protein n=1 Tax=Steinernema glaseri TaxID=37863 RepID=A0A1I7Z0Z6_9BILA
MFTSDRDYGKSLKNILISGRPAKTIRYLLSKMSSTPTDVDSFLIPRIDWSQQVIEGTSFTVDWILKAFGTHGQSLEANEIVNVSVSNISNGYGFASEILRIVIHCSEHSKMLSVVLKIPTPHLKDRVHYFNREIKFYDNFSDLVPIPLPRIYRTIKWEPPKTLGAILMEDLSRSCHVQSVCEGLSVEQLLSISKHLANMHNSFWNLPSQQRNSFERQFPIAEGRLQFQVDYIVSKALELVQKHSDVFGDRLDKYVDILKDVEYHRYTAATVRTMFKAFIPSFFSCASRTTSVVFVLQRITVYFLLSFNNSCAAAMCWRRSDEEERKVYCYFRYSIHRTNLSVCTKFKY